MIISHTHYHHLPLIKLLPGWLGSCDPTFHPAYRFSPWLHFSWTHLPRTSPAHTSAKREIRTLRLYRLRDSQLRRSQFRDDASPKLAASLLTSPKLGERKSPLVQILEAPERSYIADFLPFVIATCLLNFPLTNLQSGSYLECDFFSELATLLSFTSGSYHKSRFA
jgi:hypothetical protein